MLRKLISGLILLLLVFAAPLVGVVLASFVAVVVVLRDDDAIVRQAPRVIGSALFETLCRTINYVKRRPQEAIYGSTGRWLGIDARLRPNFSQRFLICTPVMPVG